MSVMCEPVVVPDTFATGRLAPEDLGNGNWRLTFYAKHLSLDGSTEECIVVSRLVMSSDTIIKLVPSTMKALGIACCGGERMSLRSH